MIFSHGSLLEAVQEHPVGDAVTATVSDPPDAVNERDVEPIVTTHGAPAWLTVNVLPLIDRVADRGSVPGFAPTV